MTSLYLRGVAMGMMFTSISTIALYDIPREKMAQASGMLNTMRQLGGSLGVAIMSTLLSSRVNYHIQMYGSSVQSNSPVYHNVINRLGFYIQHHIGSSQVETGKLNLKVLLSNLNTQGYIQGIDDVFLVAAAITLFGVIPVFFLHEKKKKQYQRVKK